MLGLLDKITGRFTNDDRNDIVQGISRSIASVDPEVVKQLTSSNMEHLFGGLLMHYLMTELADEKLSDQGAEGGSAQKDGKGSGQAGEVKSKLREVAEKFSLRLGDERTLLDEGLMSVLPKIIEQLIVQKEQQALENMLKNLVDNLKSENSDVRAGAARGLADILEHLPADRKNEILDRISGGLLDWIKTETVMSSAYSKICEILQNIIQGHLTQKQFTETLIYLDTISSIACGDVKQTDAAKKLCADLIAQLASPENILILQNEINADDNDEKMQTGQVFALLGQNAVNHVLDQLRHTDDSDERVKMMHLITAANEKALPLVTGRIRKKEPWYYLRNLAYMLGQIGNEDSARTLAPLLQHENIRLRQEALRSVQRIGGNSRGNLLISALPQADEEFKLNLIEALGQSKVAEAVSPLLAILKERPLMTSSARINLEEKICIALGAIGSPDAIPFLSEIAETKSFLSLRSYPEKVKGAAARALVTLRRKVAESGPENL
jgi:HEAT repeat protein